MAVTNPNDEGNIYVYPLEPENLKDHLAFIKLTSFKHDLRLYGTTFDFFLDDDTRSATRNDLSSTPSNHIYLPIPNGGLGFEDSLDYNQKSGGVTLASRGISTMTQTLKDTIGVNVPILDPDILETTVGQTLNSFLVHTFKGINLRQYSFNWSFIPYSERDSNVLSQIIKILRTSSLPEYEPSALTINYPEYWVVEPIIKTKRLFELNHLFVSDIKVTYGEDGGVTFFNDGSPVKTNLSVTFKEVYPSGKELVK